jgi:hypothetical protein
MSPEEKSAQYLDLNANKRLLEIQAEIVSIEKRRLYDNLTDLQREELKARIEFLVSEQRMIFEARYAKQKEIKQAENLVKRESKDIEIKEILKNEIVEDKKIEGELKEIIEATKDRKWYEKWWGKLIIIILGAVLISILEGKRIVDLTDLLG